MKRLGVNVAFKTKCLYEIYFKRLLKEKRIDKEKVRINVFGKWKEIFPQKLKGVVENALRRTEKYKNYFLTINRSDVLIVRNVSSPNKKYLYNILEEKGFDKKFLYRKTTTHPS